MSTFFKKIQAYVSTHKKTSIAIAIVLLIFGYWLYKKITTPAVAPTYVLGTVEKGTVVASITGSGQVSSGRTLDLKPQASGNVVYIGATEGQQVNAGDLIVELDATNTQKSVRDAQANLASAQLALQKIQEPTDNLSLLQAQDSLTQSKNDLASSYDDGMNEVSNTFLDIPSIVSGVDSTLHGTDINPGTSQQNISFYTDTAGQLETTTTYGKASAFRDDAERKYAAAKAAYDKNFIDYKSTDRNASTDTIQNLINETYTTATLVSDAVKSANNLIQYYQDTLTTAGRTPNPKSTTQLATLSGYLAKANSHATNLLSAKNTIANDLVAIPEKEASLAKLQSGADSLDVQSSQLSVTKAQNALQDAKDTLENYYVRAPFTGTLAKLDVKMGDPASSGTAVATVIATDQVVDIPLNEVDVSKVKIGDKATMTFDAIDTLTLTGKVGAIDTVGTVTQGVVNYTVTINFDTIDPRVKPGMSTTASIMTDVHQDVLMVPSSAVKSTNGGSYVQAFATTPTTLDANGNVVSITAPDRITVTTGISDDTNTEITSGLTEGQEIVTKTIQPTTSTTTTSAPSLLGGGAARTGAAGGSGALRGVAR